MSANNDHPAQTTQIAKTLNSFESDVLTASDLVKSLLFLYSGAPDDEFLVIGTWEVIEPDPDQMTIHTLPRFQAGMRVTIGQLKAMQNDE